MSAEKIDNWLDPRYIQISRQEAARIIGRSLAEFDRLRKGDPECPAGYKTGKDRSARVLFRLSDIYAYSERLMSRTETTGSDQ